MIWGFILVVALGLSFIKLGSYSVLVTLLSFGLKIAVLLIVVLLVGFVWRKYYA